MARSSGCRLIFLPLLLLLSIVVVHATEEAEDPGKNAENKSGVLEDTSTSSAESWRISPTVPEDVSSDAWPEHVPGDQTDRRPLREEDDDEAGPNDDEDEEEYEGEADGGGEEEEEGEEDEDEDEDEYVDELKAIAESHEAMSKGDARNSNASSMDGLISSNGARERTPQTSQTFESDETSLAESSDEDVASNEAIIDEVFDKSQDQEVAELLKYKKEKNSNVLADERAKSKRVPTVKKELSTQREILIASNETQVPKTLIPSEETLNRLNEEIADPPQRRDLQTKETEAAAKARQESAQQERPTAERKISVDNRYTSMESTSEGARRLDKRQQETFLTNLRSYLLAEYAAEREQRQKLEELGVREGALAENLLKLLVNLAENPAGWDRVHQLLPEIENELDVSKITREPEKRAYDTSLHSPITTSVPVDDTEKGKKKPKKKKKKKKKPKHTTTTTVTPRTFAATTVPSMPTTADTPWLTTQWRQVAERLLGYKAVIPTKVHYTMPSKNNTVPKSFGIEKIHASADDVKEPLEVRPVHFGKMNTHLPAHEADARPRTSAFDHHKDPSPARTESHGPGDQMNQRSRYESMPEVSQEIGHSDVQDDYQDDFSPSMDYGQAEFGSKNRFGMSYDYDRPWTNEERGFPPSVPSNRWNWRRPAKENRKYWPQQSQAWRADDDFWTRGDDEPDDGNFNMPIDRSWPRRESMRNAWNADRSKLPPWIHEDVMKARERPSAAWAKNKNLPESQESGSTTKEKNKENTKLPKITMKAWNSLTSDPATWPYKLPGAKPWPKDANGKSYNPNADLVKKLGLDDNEGPWSKEEKLNLNGQGMMSQRKSDARKPWMIPNEAKDWTQAHRNVEDNLGRSEEASAWRGKYEDSPKIQSVGAWVMPADRSNWRPYEIKPMEEEDARRQWTPRLNIPDRSWPISRGRESWLSDASWAARNGISGSWPGTGKSSSQSWMEKSNPWLPKNREPWLSGGSIGPWSSKSDDDSVRPSRSKAPWLSNAKIDRWGSKSADDVIHRPPKSSDPTIWGVDEILRSSAKSKDRWLGSDVHSSIKSRANDEVSWSGGNSDVSPWLPQRESGSAWSSKSSERNPWSAPKPIEPSPYLAHRRINEEWNAPYGKEASSNNWPASRWFAYHRVTALPIAKPGTNMDAGAKSKNAYVAVSALSSPKYAGNEWRKNEIEEVPFVLRNDHSVRTRSEDAEGLTIGSGDKVDMRKRTVPGTVAKENGTDLLESQLEALGRRPAAALTNSTDSVERASSQPVDHLTPIIPTNSTALDKVHEDVVSTKAANAEEEQKKVEQDESEASPKKEHEEAIP